MTSYGEAEQDLTGRGDPKHEQRGATEEGKVGGAGRGRLSEDPP